MNQDTPPSGQPQRIPLVSGMKIGASAGSEEPLYTRPWIAVSLIFSMVVINWAYSIPKRANGSPDSQNVATKRSDVPSAMVDFGDGLWTAQNESASTIRDVAKSADQKLLAKLATRRADVSKPVPGIEEIRVKWRLRTERVEREARELKDASEGSIEWQYQQDLLESLKDGPT